MDANQLSYARCAETRAGRVMIRGLENLAGRKRMIRALDGYQDEVADGKSFWSVMWERFGLSWEIDGAGMDGVPKEGPLVLVANHPFGIIDGFALCHLLSQVRPDFKILSNEWLVPAPEIMHHILPIDRGEDKETLKRNIATRREAIETLKGGGCVAIFPAGTVSITKRPFRRAAFDAHWKPLAASLIQLTQATVTPVFIHGQNGRLYQIAGHISDNLRIGLAALAFKKQMREPVKMTIGDALDVEQLKAYFGNPSDMMRFLRARTYSLSPEFMDELTRGKAWG